MARVPGCRSVKFKAQWPATAVTVRGLTSSVEHGEGGDTVVVTGRRQVKLPFVGVLGIGTVTVTATSRASSVRLGDH